MIWAGSDDGLVHVTRDGGKNWSNVTQAMRGLPEWATISVIEPSPFDAATAYVVVDAHRLDDTKPYLFKTTDYGRTWTRLDAGLAQEVYLHAVREDPARRGQLYLGTERGVMYSSDDGKTWQSLKLNLPTVAVHDLIVKGDDLVLATHGRSIWILDDLQPVRDADARVLATPVHLFPAADAVRWRVGDGSWASRLRSVSEPAYRCVALLLPPGKGQGRAAPRDSRRRKPARPHAQQHAREPDMSGEYDDPEDFKKKALPTIPAFIVRSGTSPGRARSRSRMARSTPAIPRSARVPCLAPTRRGSRSTARR